MDTKLTVGQLLFEIRAAILDLRSCTLDKGVAGFKAQLRVNERRLKLIDDQEVLNFFLTDEGMCNMTALELFGDYQGNSTIGTVSFMDAVRQAVLRYLTDITTKLFDIHIRLPRER